MSFDVAAEAYWRFMGRFSEPLALEFLELVDPRPGQRALDVGAGPGALTAPLAARLGANAVAAVEPSEPFAAALRDRLPGVDVRRGVCEQLPYDDDAFDLALAQLVVHFMSDPVAGCTEMARVTRPDGLVAASVWDYENERSPISFFWRAALDLFPDAPGEGHLPGTRAGQLAGYFAQAGLRDIEAGVLTVRVEMASFDDWWEPYTLGVGPGGQYLVGLDEGRRESLRGHCRELLPDGPFPIEAAAWVAVGRA